MIRQNAGSRVTAGGALALGALVMFTSCTNENGAVTPPQKEVQTSMSSHDEVATVSPALERLRQHARTGFTGETER